MLNEENKIQEAQISEPGKPAVNAVNLDGTIDDSMEVPKKKRQRDFYVEMALFFILGILIGITVKTEAIKNVTIGFDDYKMKIRTQDYNINQIQKDLTAGQVEKENDNIE